MLRRIALLLAFVPLFATAAAQDIRIDGSSTVYPVALAIAEEFGIEFPAARVSVAFSGTGAGFEKFCRGETDMSGASRPIRQSEIDLCAANGIEFVEIPIAGDALTVIVNKANDFATCMTTDELKMAWEPDSGVTTWADIRPEWPAEAIEFYGAGTDSGTFDYFTEAIMGESGAIRTDFFPSEDDNVLVLGVAGNEYAMGFFGFAYFVENQGHAQRGRGRRRQRLRRAERRERRLERLHPALAAAVRVRQHRQARRQPRPGRVHRVRADLGPGARRDRRDRLPRLPGRGLRRRDGARERARPRDGLRQLPSW